MFGLSLSAYDPVPGVWVWEAKTVGEEGLAKITNKRKRKQPRQTKIAVVKYCLKERFNWPRYLSCLV